MKSSKADYDRFSLTIPRELNDWLYTITRKIKEQGGYRIPKTTFIRALIRAFQDKETEVNLRNIRTKSNPKIGGLTNSEEIETMLIYRIKQAFK